MVISESPTTAAGTAAPAGLAEIGLVGLAVMGQNLALNIAEKGFSIAVYNRSSAKVDDTVARAEREGLSDRLTGYKDVAEFIQGLSRPRKIIMLVKAGAPVDATIATLQGLLEEGDLIIDGGNEFFTNTERRGKALQDKGIMYMGMGVSGGEEGARNGPSLMPGGPKSAWELIKPMMEKVSAQVDDGPCVTYIGPGGSGNYVKMVHNGIEYGDMQLIGEAYDLLRNVAGLSVEEISDVFEEWNAAELQSFLIEITAKILRQKDDLVNDGSYLVDKVLDQTGSKGTGMWTMQEAAARGVPAPTIGAALEARFVSALKKDREIACGVLEGPAFSAETNPDMKKQIVADVRKALYASKICSYAQGMNIIRTAGVDGDWGLNLGAISRIWKGGCIIRAKFLDRIKAAYDRDASLPSLLLDEEFAAELIGAQESWRRIAVLAITNGIAIPATASSLNYYDSFRREVLMSAQMVQAQRDFFGSHTYKRLDKDGVYHTRWSSDGVSVKQD
ncbi:6-phosphogluconate dehydrogenase decarboxylating [Gracilaria domingensis]|nr:6-phosphogluconate dehydrogenase decarboxylating [Gracilaria domingensis]